MQVYIICSQHITENIINAHLNRSVYIRGVTQLYQQAITYCMITLIFYALCFRVQRKIVEIEYTITRVQGRELRAPLGANGLSRFSVSRSTITSARDRTRDWQAWEKWITRECEGKGEQESRGNTHTWGCFQGNNSITQRYCYPLPITKEGNM